MKSAYFTSNSSSFDSSNLKYRIRLVQAHFTNFLGLPYLVSSQDFYPYFGELSENIDLKLRSMFDLDHSVYLFIPVKSKSKNQLK